MLDIKLSGSAYRIDAEWILCVDEQNRTLNNHSVIIDHGEIRAIIPTPDAEQISVSEVVSLKKHVLMPGLINAHGHASMALFRGIANDLPLMEWLQNHIWPAEAKWVDAQFVHDGARLAIAEMLMSGTTTFSDMYFFPEQVAQVSEDMGIRAQLCCPILDFPTAWGNGPDEYIEKTLALNESYKSSELIDIAFGPHAPYTVSDAPFERIIQEAKKHSISIQIHLHETQQEVDDALAAGEEKPINRLNRLGLFDKTLNLQCVHMTALDDSDINFLASMNSSVIHCPESNLKLASGFCPTAALMKAGVNIAIGTDGAASNNDLDMLGETKTAALIAKAYAKDASAINANDALRMATINGARALGIDHICGSIELGKKADLVALDFNQLNTQPSFHPTADIIYSASAQQVSDVWVNGVRQLQDGSPLNFDKTEIINSAQTWARKINNTSEN
jgi:5-methylthioadenosine/S-adenosylhomocysteine deaminase